MQHHCLTEADHDKLMFKTTGVRPFPAEITSNSINAVRPLSPPCVPLPRTGPTLPAPYIAMLDQTNLSPEQRTQLMKDFAEKEAEFLRFFEIKQAKQLAELADLDKKQAAEEAALRKEQKDALEAQEADLAKAFVYLIAGQNAYVAEQKANSWLITKEGKENFQLGAGIGDLGKI